MAESFLMRLQIEQIQISYGSCFLINENKWKSLVNEKKVKRYIFLYTLQGEKTKNEGG